MEHFWNITKALEEQKNNVDFLTVCYSDGERICYNSVIIPEMSKKEDRAKAILFLREFDPKMKQIIWAQIHHFKNIKGKAAIKFGVCFNDNPVPLKLLY